MIERYIVRVGKFGAYIYDVNLKKDMTLKDVVDRLNSLCNEIKILDNELMR